MKKLTERRRRWLQHRQRRAVRKLRRPGHGHEVERPAAIPSVAKRTVAINTRNGNRLATLSGEARSVPGKVSLESNYEETATFLSEVRTQLQTSWRRNKLKQPTRRVRRKFHSKGDMNLNLKNYFDFSKIETISPETALIIASEYHTITQCGGWIPFTIDIDKWQPDVVALLRGIGFFELVGISDKASGVIEGDGWRMLRFRSGALADGETVQGLLNEMNVASVLPNPEIYEGIVEALVNARQHAYPEGSDFESPHWPGWWLTGFVDDQNSRLRISVFDRGLTIPGTLTTWKKYPLYRRLWALGFGSDPDLNDWTRDGTAISIAMEVGRSSTGEPYRGRGLPQIEALVDLCRRGQLTIYSRCGQYLKRNGERPEYYNRSTPLGGTLISWDLSF